MSQPGRCLITKKCSLYFVWHGNPQNHISWVYHSGVHHGVGEASTSGTCRSRANTNTTCALTHYHVGFLSGLSCRNCGEFGQMCTPALWPGKCLHMKGGKLIHEESKRTSAHGWPLSCEQSARWDEALLFFPCCCSLILFESCSKGSSLNLYTGLSMMGRNFTGPQPLGGPRDASDDDSHITCVQVCHRNIIFGSWHPNDLSKLLI